MFEFYNKIASKMCSYKVSVCFLICSCTSMPFLRYFHAFLEFAVPV